MHIAYGVVVEMKYSIEEKNCRIPIRHFSGVKIQLFQPTEESFFTILKNQHEQTWTNTILQTSFM